MKICHNCQGAMDDEAQVCPTCGAPWEAPAAETSAEAPEAAPETVEAAPEAPEASEAAPVMPETTPESPTPKKGGRGAVVALVLVAVLAVAAVVGKSAWDRNRAQNDAAQSDTQDTTADTPSDASESDATTQITAEEAAANPLLHNNAYGYRSYSAHFATDEATGEQVFTYLNADGETVTIPAEDVEKAMDTVVATAGSLELTNRELLYYYDQQYYSFYTNYGSYLMYLMDTTKPLDEQLDLNGADTWQKFFIDASLQAFQQTAALYDEAMAAGYTLDEDMQASLDSLADDLNAVAVQNGYDDAERYLDDFFGAAATLESYRTFLEVNQIASGYANSLINSMTFTDAELSDYYDANAESLQSSYGLQKVDKNVIDVRHILISPEDTESEESWAAAEAEAQRIYDEWKAGEATEESFAALATEYTQDPGSQTTGGLYEDVYPGQMVTEFNDWCFADGRAVGDSEIVKTSYGYHIMYFSGEGEDIYWKLAVEELMRSERFTETLTELAQGYPMVSSPELFALLDRTAPTAPSAESEESGETESADGTNTGTETPDETNTGTETAGDTSEEPQD